METTTWRATCILKNMPRKVLGLIVEHLGEIPEAGQAMQVKQGAPQRKLFTEDEDAFCGLTPEDSVNPSTAHIVSSRNTLTTPCMRRKPRKILCR